MTRIRRLPSVFDLVPPVWHVAHAAPPEGVGQSLADLCDPLWSATDASAAGHPVPRLAERLGDAAAAVSDRIGWHYFAHAGVRDRLLAAS